MSPRERRGRRSVLVFFTVAVLVAVAAAGASDGAWLDKVPDRDRTRANPMAADPNAVTAGAKLFRQNCAKCHGDRGEGVGKKPALTTDRVRAATPGELEWLLRNGSLRNGMPSWSRLPEPQRWQIVSYLKTMSPQ